MVPVYHTKCKKIAFYLVHRLQPGGILLAKNVRKTDGTTPEPRTQIKCGSCNEYLGFNELYQGEYWMDWFMVPEFQTDSFK